MGKDSLIKSTTKKRPAGTSTKKTTTKKSAPAAKKPAAKKSVRATAAIKAPKTGTGAKSGAARGPAETPTTPPSARELRQRRFPRWEPEAPFRPAPRPADAGTASPAFFADRTPAEAARLKALLLKKIDLSDAAPPPQQPPGEETGSARPGAAPPCAPGTPQDPPCDGAQPPPAQPSFCDTRGDDPMDKMTKYIIAGVAALLLLVVGASTANQKRFYLKPMDGDLEVWQGRFAPKGSERLTVLEDVAAPAELQPRYTREEVFPMVYGHYTARADALLQAPGVPDFDAIRENLAQAEPYAVTGELRENLAARLNGIDMLVLVYKADIAAQGGTVEGVQKAIDLLREAQDLELARGQREMLRARLEVNRELLERLEGRKSKS